MGFALDNSLSKEYFPHQGISLEQALEHALEVGLAGGGTYMGPMQPVRLQFEPHHLD